MQLTENNDHRKYGLIGTLLFHAALAALFFLMVFTGPNPPLDQLGGSGIEVNYGIDPAGYGDIQTMAQANESKNTEDSKPSGQTPETTVSPVAQPEEKVDEVKEERIITSTEESPVSVKEIEKPKPKEEKKEEVKAPEKPRALYPGKNANNTSGNGNTGSSNSPTGNNNGDKPGSVGDQGNPEGTLDSKNLYGNPGKGGPGKGGSGGNLDMPGWGWDKIPRPNDQTNESGRLVFEIKIENETGEIIAVRKIESTVSAALERLYRAEVDKTTFSRTGGNKANATGTTTGRITFIIKTN